MAKVLLVEDDNNLREIYEARLQAEGHEIASAQDGEQALVVAKDFKPDLIISDVMMPKISGFEMLDILRNTEGLKHTKVIMLTALGQAEDKTRADSLGADRYLVKSQVTLEDIVRAAHQIMEGDDDSAFTTTIEGGPAAGVAAATAEPAAPAEQPAVATPVTPAPTPAEPAAPSVAVSPAPEPSAPVASTTDTGSAIDTTPASEPSIAAPTVGPSPTPTPTPVDNPPTTSVTDDADAIQTPSAESTPTPELAVAPAPAEQPPESTTSTPSDSTASDGQATTEPISEDTNESKPAGETTQPNFNPALPNEPFAPVAPATPQIAAAQPKAPASNLVDEHKGSIAAEQAVMEKQIEDFINTTAAEAETEPAAASTSSTEDTSAQYEPAPSEPVDEPITVAPVASSDNQATDDQLIADAIKDLGGDVPPANADSLGQIQPVVIQPDGGTEASAPASEKEEDTGVATNMTTGSAAVSGKKIIQPLPTTPKPTLEELLAVEEGRAPTPPPSAPPVMDDTANTTPPHQPGDAIHPQPETGGFKPPQGQQPKRDDGFNPNNIAL